METTTTNNIADFGVNTNITIDDWLLLKILGGLVAFVVIFFTIRKLAE